MQQFKVLFFEDEAEHFSAPYVDALEAFGIEVLVENQPDRAYEIATALHSDLNGLIIDSIASAGESLLLKDVQTNGGERTGVKLLCFIQLWEREHCPDGILPAFIVTNRLDEDVQETCKVEKVFRKMDTLPLEFAEKIRSSLASRVGRNK